MFCKEHLSEMKCLFPAFTICLLFVSIAGAAPGAGDAAQTG
jgi:hypothetical protein